MRVNELDRILDGDDVAPRVVVAMADHRRQRGRFARARAAHDQHQAALGHDDVAQLGRQIELFEGGDLGVDGAHDHPGVALMHEGADPVAAGHRLATTQADFADGDGEVALVRRVELARLLIVHDRAHDQVGLLRGQGGLGNGADLAVDLHRGRKLRRDEHVRSAREHHLTQQVLDQPGSLFSFHRKRLPEPWRAVPAD